MLKTWQSRLFWVTFFLTAVTGINLIFFRDFIPTGDSDTTLLQPYIKIHILAAAAMLFSLGVVFTRHALPYIKTGKSPGKKTGITLLSLSLPVVLSGYLLQIVYTPAWQAGSWWVHSITGIVFILLFFIHQISTGSQKPLKLSLLIIFFIGSTSLPYLFKTEKPAVEELPEEIDLSDIDLKSSNSNDAVRTYHAMGTYLTIDLRNHSNAETLAENIYHAIRNIEKAASTYDSTSELNRFNNRAVKNYRVSETLSALISDSLKFHETTAGAFNPALLKVMQQGRFRNNRVTTGRSTTASDISEFKFNSKENMIISKPADIIFDFGGIGKGFALAHVNRRFNLEETECSKISFGGQWLISGRSCNLKVGIRHPDKEELLTDIQLPGNGSVSTSAATEKSITAGDKKISHIYNTSTREFREAGFSVTVYHPDATAADALSTGIAAEPALVKKIVRQYPGTGIILYRENQLNRYGVFASFKDS